MKDLKDIDIFASVEDAKAAGAYGTFKNNQAANISRTVKIYTFECTKKIEAGEIEIDGEILKTYAEKMQVVGYILAGTKAKREQLVECAIENGLDLTGLTDIKTVTHFEGSHDDTYTCVINLNTGKKFLIECGNEE